MALRETPLDPFANGSLWTKRVPLRFLAADEIGRSGTGAREKLVSAAALNQAHPGGHAKRRLP
jgi:hypothetical protein